MTQNAQELSNVCDIKNGFAFKSSQYKSEGTPLLRISNFDNGDVFLNSKQIYVDSGFLKSKKDFIVSKGDVLIALSGATTGKYGIYNFDYPSLLNQRIGLIKSGASENLNSRYFYYYLNILKIDILRNAGGAAQPNISTKKISGFKIPLPPLKTQKKIASILDNAAALCDKTSQLLKEYDLLAQSIFLEMFGDPAINQKNWDLVKFGDVGKLDRGKSKHRPRNAPELLGGIYPLIQTGDIANCDGYITEFRSTYSELGLAQSKMWPKGTLCITVAANIAKTGILAMDACFPDSVVGFIPNELTNNQFTQFWMSFLQKIIEANAPQAAQKNINLKILRELDFFSPPIELQNQFAEKIALIEQQKALTKQELQESEDLFNCLLQKAFKGELI